VWLSTCRIVVPVRNYGQYRVIGSSKAINPRSTSISTASAITGLPTE
jgi:hypothetical protein